MTGKPIRALALAVAAAAALGSDLAGQQALVPYAGAGIAFGTGDLAQDSNLGWSVFGGLDVPLSPAGLSVGAMAIYTRIPYSGDFGEYEGVTAVMAEVGYELMAASPGMFRPYVRAGAGLHVNRYDPGSLDADPSTLSRAGVTAGVGVNFLFGAVTGFVGGRFLGDIDRGFLGLHAGLALR
jgi:hypothetical protein